MRMNRRLKSRRAFVRSSRYDMSITVFWVEKADGTGHRKAEMHHDFSARPGLPS